MPMICRHDPDAVNDSIEVLVAQNALIDCGLPEIAANVFGNRSGLPMMPSIMVIHPSHTHALFMARWLGHKASGHDVRRLRLEPHEPQDIPFAMICYECWNRSIRKAIRQGNTKCSESELFTPYTFEEYCAPRAYRPERNTR